MKAIVHTEYGPPELPQLTQIEQPVPRGHEILIRVRGTTVTAPDYRIRGFKVSPGFSPFARLRLGVLGPRQTILGIKLAGEGVR